MILKVPYGICHAVCVEEEHTRRIVRQIPCNYYRWSFIAVVRVERILASRIVRIEWKISVR